jgi:enterochelin esterase-like enzyme
MRRARLAFAGTTVAVAGAALGIAVASSDGSSVSAAATFAQFLPVAHGLRRGVLLAGAVPAVGRAVVYEPLAARHGRRLRVVYIVSAHGSPSLLARRIGLAATGDELVWDGTIPPFVAVVARPGSASALARLQSWTRAALPAVRGTSPPIVMQAPALEHTSLAGDLTVALQSRAARAATTAASRVIPPRFGLISSGPAGGTIWQGRIPGAAVPRLRRDSLVYLPPDVDPSRSYPLVILLHGLRGSPYSFAGGLRLPDAVDPAIAAGRLRPFIAVMPPAGLGAAFDGEWSGAWEHYVVDDVLPWASQQLPVAQVASSRVIAGFSAGGFGAADIALRHPGLFGAAESWSGYFGAPHDGSLRGAPRAELAAHSPIDLAEKEHRELRALGTRFLLSAGRHERAVLRATRRFGLELRRLHLPVRVLVTQGGHDGRQWHAILRPGLAYSLPSAPAGRGRSMSISRCGAASSPTLERRRRTGSSCSRRAPSRSTWRASSASSSCRRRATIIVACSPI